MLFVRVLVIGGLLTFLGDSSRAQQEPCAYSNCPPKECYYDLACGLGCFCYKGSGQLKGVCVSK